jgi:two-component system, NarL family, invasion response regulator UvrY
MNSIVIIDKHPVVRVGLRHFVGQFFESTLMIEFDSLSQYLKVRSGSPTEVLIIGNTLELFNSVCHSIAEIRKNNDTSQIIIFDENPDYIKIVRSFKAGAKGYLTKFSDMQEFFKCVSKVKEGRIYICHDALGLILPNYLPAGSTQKKGRTWLSPREYDVANLLMLGDTISMIAQKMGKKEGTVRSTKTRIFKKLKIADVSGLKESFKRYLENKNETQQNV